MTKQVATIHTSIWPRGHFIWAVVILASLAIVVGSAWPTSLAAQNQPSPDTPDRPTGTAVFVGGVDLEWNEVSGAESYEVQLYRNARWNDLPGDGVDIAFYGAGAIISGLNHTGFSYYFQVRANNAYGTSDWSEYLLMSSTSEYTSGKRDRPGNVPATGAPTVSGTVQEGETLTADTSGIADENGLDRVKFYYQWVSGEGAAAADIAGATGSSYTLANADAGKAVNVRVSFTDRGGYAESRSSAATGVATPTPPPPTPEPAAGICDRTQQVRDAILAKLPDVNDCSAVTADDLSSIAGRLGFSRTNIAALQGVDFHGLSSLEYLNISHNELSALPDGVFDGLSSLADLRLYGNDLSELPDSVFDGLSSLEMLSLSGNELSALPDGVFDGLSSLERLYLGGNELSALPDGVFDGLSSLERLYLSDNDLNELPDGVFDGLSSLAHLRLYGNELSALPDGVFDNLSSLENLSLDENDLSELPDGMFDGLSSLEHLNIGRNGLSALPGGMFEGLSSLEHLYLYGNELSALPDGVFEGLSSLEHLLLNSNDLSALPDGVFDGLPNLADLHLYGNELSALPDGVFDGLSRLQFLFLQENELSALPDGVFDNLSSLEYLHLYENDLSELPDGVFDGLSNLYELNLSGNPGAPFTITAELEQQADYAFVVKIAEGTPFDMKVTLSFQGAAQEGATVTVEGGSVRSLPISVTPSGTGQPRVTVSVESAVFKNPRVYFMVDVSYPYYATGVETGLGDDLILPGESENTPATGAPSISGTAQVGETLTADTSGIADADGLSGVTFSYQWLSSRDTEIQGATGATYTLVAADAGKTIKVRVSFTDAAGNAESLTSAATAAVAQEEPTEPPPPQNLTATVNEDGSVTLNWEAPDDDSVTGYRVLRRRPSEGEKTLLVYVADTESTATTYTDTGVVAGIQHVYRVQAVNAAGAGEQSHYVNVTPAQPEPEPDQNAPATGAPAISGTAQVGETLTADTSGIADADGLSNVSFSYQWLADGTVIAGATGSGYTLTDSEAGKAIRVRVSFSDDADNQETLTSAATAAVEAVPTPNSPATGQPAITGTAQVGETLTADTSSIGDEDGLDNASFTYQWLADAADIAGATSSTYTLAAADEGKTVRVGVSFSDDAGNEETLTSAATAAIEAAVAEAEPTEPPPAPTNLTAVVNADGSATLTWEAPDDDSITGYLILRRRPYEGEQSLLVYVADTGSTATTWTDTNVTAGTQHVYRVKAINDAGAGEQSNYVNVDP